MTVYYNEFDPFAAEWLRELIKAGHIAPGDVDDRSIKDVQVDDLQGYTQCHFFAGIGVWSHALRSAGWSDERPVWTGSCPCQPFSAAGKGGGFDDARHLWPDFFRLIAECRPDVVLGEQVASKDGLAWLDLVYADLEGADYAVGAVDTCAAGFGAPHIRQRLYWTGIVADAAGGRQPWAGGSRAAQDERTAERGQPGGLVGLADAVRDGAEHGPGQGVGAQAAADRGDRCVSGQRLRAGVEGPLCGMADTSVLGRVGRRASEASDEPGTVERPERLCDADGLADAEGEGRPHGRSGATQPLAAESGGSSVSPGRSGPTNGLWRDADWLGCRDGKWRPVMPGSFPLAHGAAARVGRLRGYGNAIVAPQAQAFVEAVMSCS